jgi:hypothetical protein
MPEEATMKRKSRGHGAHLVLAFALVGALPAFAAPTGTNQQAPGMADTPGEQSSLRPVELALRDDYPRFEQGLVVLDSDVLLKAYYFAYAAGPVDKPAILTQNTEDIVAPKPVQPTSAQSAAIDRLLKLAREHRRLLIRADDVAFDPFDAASGAYAVSNRLFIPGARYYFDNSAYHFIYKGADALHAFRVPDKATQGAINDAVSHYRHFSLDIVAHVSDGVPSHSALELEVEQVTVKGVDGKSLLVRVVK